MAKVIFNVTNFVSASPTSLQLTGHKVFDALTRLTVKQGAATGGTITKASPIAQIKVTDTDFETLEQGLKKVPAKELPVTLVFDDLGAGKVKLTAISL